METTHTITIPGWTKPPLNLNDRHHWRTQHRLTKTAKQTLQWALIAAQLPKADHAHLTLTYQPPDNRRRDKDNLYATIKVAQDALTTLGIIPDDDHTHCHSEVHITPKGPPFDNTGSRIQITLKLTQGTPQ